MDAVIKLQGYGPTEDHLLTNGTLIQVFSSHTLPLSHLLEENWAVVHPCGHFRSVRRVTRLKDGTSTGIYVKSAERVFTTEPRKLAKGIFWWGGSRSGEKPIFILNQSIVEERTVWEAVYLLELDRLGISAEKPQALVTHTNGDKELLVAEVHSSSFTNCLEYDARLIETLTRVGFLPNDLQALANCSGRHIIDVNRWEWMPVTNTSRRKLLELICELTRI